MAKTGVNSPARASNIRGRAWNMPFDAIDPAGADDHFLHIKNSGKLPLQIFEVEVVSTVAGFLEPFRASGVATTPTAVIPVPLGESSNGPVGTFEVGADLQVTAGAMLSHIYLAANTPRNIDFRAGIIIPSGGALGFNWTAGTGVLSGHVGIMEVTEEDKLD
jgi:hypothetical protein